MWHQDLIFLRLIFRRLLLADPEAIHPAYINKYLFEADCSKIPELIEKPTSIMELLRISWSKELLITLLQKER